MRLLRPSALKLVAREHPFDSGFTMAAGLSGLLFIWLVTRGIMIAPLAASRNHYYTIAAINLLHGRLDVPHDALGQECFTLANRCYGYFGLTPSLLRLPLALVHLLPVSNSTEVAFFASAWLTVALGAWWIARQLFEVWAPAARGRERVVLGFVAALALLGASPVLFLGGRPLVYEEAILWSIAFASVAIGAVIAFRSRPRVWVGVVLVVTDVLGVSARPTVGASAVFATVVLGISLIRGPSHDPRSARPLGHPRIWGTWFVLGVVVALLSAPAMAYAKFGTTSPPYQYHGNIGKDPAALQIYLHPGGVNPAVLPTKLFSFLRPDTLHVLGRPPFVAFGEVRPLIIWPARAADYATDPTASLSATMPFSTIVAVVGCAAVAWAFRRWWRTKVRDTRLEETGLAFISVLGALGLGLVFPGQVFRYTADWLPLFFVAVPVGLAVGGTHLRTVRQDRKPIVLGLAALLLGFQLFVQTGLAVRNGVFLGAERPNGCISPLNPYGVVRGLFCP